MSNAVCQCFCFATTSAGLGDPQEANKIREQIQYLEKDGMSLPLGPVLLQMCLGAIGGFALAAGITALVRSTAR